MGAEPNEQGLEEFLREEFESLGLHGADAHGVNPFFSARCFPTLQALADRKSVV